MGARLQVRLCLPCFDVGSDDCHTFALFTYVALSCSLLAPGIQSILISVGDDHLRAKKLFGRANILTMVSEQSVGEEQSRHGVARLS